MVQQTSCAAVGTQVSPANGRKVHPLSMTEHDAFKWMKAHHRAAARARGSCESVQRTWSGNLAGASGLKAART